jgi:hypothetical protein
MVLVNQRTDTMRSLDCDLDSFSDDVIEEKLYNALQ